MLQQIVSGLSSAGEWFFKTYGVTLAFLVVLSILTGYLVLKLSEKGHNPGTAYILATVCGLAILGLSPGGIFIVLTTLAAGVLGFFLYLRRLPEREVEMRGDASGTYYVKSRERIGAKGLPGRAPAVQMVMEMSMLILEASRTRNVTEVNALLGPRGFCMLPSGKIINVDSGQEVSIGAVLNTATADQVLETG